MEVLAIISIYVAMAILTAKVVISWNEYNWKTNWKSLSRDQVYDGEFYGIVAMSMVMWPVALPVMLMIYSVDRL